MKPIQIAAAFTIIIIGEGLITDYYYSWAIGGGHKHKKKPRKHTHASKKAKKKSKHRKFDLDEKGQLFIFFFS